MMAMKSDEMNAKKLENNVKLLDLMPLELWRMVDGFTDAKSHTFLRASCSFFRDWLTGEIDVEFTEYKRLTERMLHYQKDSFQAAVHLNPHTLKQDHYDYLCMKILSLEVLRICRFALEEPFFCAHIDLGAQSNYAIREASQTGHPAVVQLLLQDPRVDPAAQDNEAIRYASIDGHSAVVELLLQDPRIDPAAEDNTAIRFASLNGHSEVVELLLQDPRVDPAAVDNQAIQNASHYQHLAVVEMLLQDPRVDPAACNNYAIRFASKNGHLAVVELLLRDPRVDPAARQNEAIRNASLNGHLAVVELLLHDTRVDPTVGNTNNALRGVSRRKYIDACRLFLSDPRVLAAYRLDPFELPVGVQLPALP